MSFRLINKRTRYIYTFQNRSTKMHKQVQSLPYNPLNEVTYACLELCNCFHIVARTLYKRIIHGLGQYPACLPLAYIPNDSRLQTKSIYSSPFPQEYHVDNSLNISRPNASTHLLSYIYNLHKQKMLCDQDLKEFAIFPVVY